MRGVFCGLERRPVSQEELYCLDGRNWTFEFNGIEFVVGGSAKGPRLDRLELAERVAACINMFGAEANEYLATFVVPERIDASRPWEVYGFEFGRRPTDQRDEFEVLLVIAGDSYGVWGVRFAYSGSPLDRFFPIEFRRRQR